MAEKNTVARPYAEALFRLAQEKNELDKWSKSVEALEQIIVNEQVANLVGNPLVGKEPLIEVMCELAGKSASATMKNFLRLLVMNDRLFLIPQIRQLFEQRRAEVNKTLTVKVVSAYAMGKPLQQELSDTLQKKLDRTIHLDCGRDPNLIGGMVIHAGDLVIDASIAGQLHKLESILSS